MMQQGFTAVKHEEKRSAFSPVAAVMGVGIALFLSLVIFVIFACLITYTSLPERYTSPVVVVTTYVSVFLAGLITARGARSKGWLNGAVTGLLYMLVVYLAGVLGTTAPLFNTAMLGRVLAALLVGAVGGIVGINMGSKKRRKR